MRFAGHASALALMLAACGRTDAQAPANESHGGRAFAAPAAIEHQNAAYAACRSRADGNATALFACADTAIAAAGRGIDSAESAAAFRAAIQELADATTEAGGASARVTFTHAAVRVARQRADLLAGETQPSTASPPATTSSVWAKSRTISCREHPVPHCATRYDALLPLTRPPAKVPPPTNTAPAGELPLPTCDEVKAGGKVGGALADTFYVRYPKSLAGEASVERIALPPPALDNVIRYLVCVAAATDDDPVVVENGLALFASKRHGAAARHALSALARSADPIAGAARRLDAQIAGYLHGLR